MDAEAGKRHATDQEIYEKIWNAIAERQVGPGTRLKEEQLSEIFSASRARIRQVLQNLARDGLITLVPNRGAFVSKPSIEEARDVFFARRTIEERLVERLCATIDADGIAKLGEHVDQERKAHQSGDDAGAIRLSGAFHMLIAELARSQILASLLRDLVSRTSLIMAMYQQKEIQSCGPDEHAAIVQSITARDAKKALAVMHHHLAHIENQLDLESDRVVARDLEDILGL
ncbi:GntR family transcriptional regulator [Aminobacter anthyllidis]|jgi:DNA-binding GntR family transcriptional regulator|uniref:GntR family transcriptional regulator n=1 Tax=Aminobacter anthyllidis TaxID=1035067 RepID=UPI0024568A8C|nr:GntR family transcriptional regulator [Aminobacter anthyllidis]MDH4985975.1 GntR family transcriptional regulator [Aminobacter anthyllidis]